MLIDMQLANYRSFKEVQQLSLVAYKADKTLEDHLITPPHSDLSLLRSAIIYGPNGAGKSNYLKGLRYLVEMVLTSAQRGKSAMPLNDPFGLDGASVAEATEVEIMFFHEGVRYQYGFSADRTRILDEWLLAYPHNRAQKWFVRDYDDETNSYTWTPTKASAGQKLLRQATRDNSLFLSMGATFNHKPFFPVFEWFQNKVCVIESAQRLLLHRYTAAAINAEPSLKGLVQTLLARADVGVADFSIVVDPALRQNLQTHAATLATTGAGTGFTHLLQQGMGLQTLFHFANGAKSLTLTENDVSEGTLRLYGLAGLFLMALRQGWLLAIDEIDGSLHPHLLRELINLFHNPKLNTTGAQLLATTHDTTLMHQNYLRRDQVWFVEKGIDGTSRLFPLLDFSPRNDTVLNRNYLLGSYGATPYIGDLAEELLAYGAA